VPPLDTAAAGHSGLTPGDQPAIAGASGDSFRVSSKPGPSEFSPAANRGLKFLQNIKKIPKTSQIFDMTDCLIK
jgi:hypothetical protein